MDQDVQNEFVRLEGRITWAAKVAVSVALAIAIPIAGGAIAVYAQSNKAISETERHDKELEKLNGTRDKVLQIEPRLENIERTVKELKDGQSAQQSILEEIRREVKK